MDLSDIMKDIEEKKKTTNTPKKPTPGDANFTNNIKIDPWAW
jgi:hypothetical protein